MTVIAIILLNLLISYTGFRRREVFEYCRFHTKPLIVNGEFMRLLSSAFIHISLGQLLLNMAALYAFSHLEKTTGIMPYLLIYTGSIVGGNIFSLFMHRNHFEYTACGSSGAVYGIVFASIALNPYTDIFLFGVPLHIAGWLFGTVYILCSIYSIQSHIGNIGHETHLAGGMSGLIITLILFPSALIQHYLPVLFMFTSSALFIAVIMLKPSLLLIDNYFFNTRRKYRGALVKFQPERTDKQQEVDRILDKIQQKGLRSLTRQEKETLDHF